MRLISLLLLLPYVVACAAPLRSGVAPFMPPDRLPNVQVVWQLAIAAYPLDTEAKSSRAFGTDLRAADILPIQLIAENKGGHEYEIDAAQIFGVRGTELYPAFTLSQAATRVRESSIGTTVVGHAVLGAIAGAAAGAAIGAAAGGAAGQAGSGAATGAALGGAVGTTSGIAAGASYRYTHKFRHELAAQDFGNRVLFPGDLRQGFIYLQAQPYTGLRVKVTNITTRTTQVIEIPLFIESITK